MLEARAGAFDCAPYRFTNGVHVGNILLDYGIGWKGLNGIAFDAVA
jgi:hypothetical protein